MSAPALKSSPILGPNGGALPAGLGAAIRQLSASSERIPVGSEMGYRADTGRNQALSGWNPSLRSADAAWLWDRDKAVARTRELLAQEPWAQGGVDSKLDMVIGASWRPSIKPDAMVLGISDDQAAEMGRLIESNFRIWAEDPLFRGDAEEQLNFSLQLHMQTMEQEVTGDGLSILRWKEQPGWGFRTALQVIDSDRLSNPNGAPDSDVLRGGVEKDPRWGAPVAAHIRNAHPADLTMGVSRGAMTWERVDWRQPWGRPQVLHLYEKKRPGQSRGVSKLIAGLARFKQMARLAENELANAVINALFAATITSSFDPALAQQNLMESATADYQTLRAGFYDTANPLLGGARIQHLFPGDELKFLTSPRETADFEGFTTVFLRSIASGLGITYEQMSGDWSNVNYASARMALIEVWRGIMSSRARVAAMVAFPVLLAVTEDALDQGLFDLPAGAPSLYEAPAAWLRGSWIGPARGWWDPVKEPLGALLQMQLGAATGEDIAAEQGNDLYTNIPALGRENAAWTAAGLKPPGLAEMVAAANALPDDPPAQATTKPGA